MPEDRGRDPDSEPTDLVLNATQLSQAACECQLLSKGKKRRHTEVTQEHYGVTGNPRKRSLTRISQSEFEKSAEVESHRGHRYKRLRISGQARLHAGDSTTVNNFYGPITALQTRLAEEVKSGRGDAAILTLAATMLIVVWLETMMCFLLQIQHIVAITTPSSLPIHIRRRSAVLEDALGRFNTVDVDFVVDWTSFHFNLARTFRGQPGLQRVANAGYRLFDKPQRLIDPRHPPVFISVFSPGRHVRMSLHFEWTEVSHQQCPRCGLLQECCVGTETTCIDCKFLYLGHVQESDLQSDKAKPRGREKIAVGDRYGLRKRVASSPRDDPAQFRRISISRQPVLQTLDTEYKIKKPASIIRTDGLSLEQSSIDDTINLEVAGYCYPSNESIDRATAEYPGPYKSGAYSRITLGHPLPGQFGQVNWVWGGGKT